MEKKSAKTKINFWEIAWYVTKIGKLSNKNEKTNLIDCYNIMANVDGKNEEVNKFLADIMVGNIEFMDMFFVKDGDVDDPSFLNYICELIYVMNISGNDNVGEVSRKTLQDLFSFSGIMNYDEFLGNTSYDYKLLQFYENITKGKRTSLILDDKTKIRIVHAYIYVDLQKMISIKFEHNFTYYILKYLHEKDDNEAFLLLVKLYYLDKDYVNVLFGKKENCDIYGVYVREFYVKYKIIYEIENNEDVVNILDMKKNKRRLLNNYMNRFFNKKIYYSLGTLLVDIGKYSIGVVASISLIYYLSIGLLVRKKNG